MSHQTKMIMGLFKPITGKGDDIIMNISEKSGSNPGLKIVLIVLVAAR